MRGPGLRVKLEIRRLWRCPRCGYERRAPGWETTVRCHCTAAEPLMQLIESQRRIPAPPQELDLYFNYEPTPEEAAADAVAKAQRAEERRLAEEARQAAEAAAELVPPAPSEKSGSGFGKRSRERPPRPQRPPAPSSTPDVTLRRPEPPVTSADPVASPIPVSEIPEPDALEDDVDNESEVTGEDASASSDSPAPPKKRRRRRGRRSGPRPSEGTPES